MAQQTCLVTGKTFDDEKSGYKWQHNGQWYYFADIAARNKFIGNPDKYIAEAQGGAAGQSGQPTAGQTAS